MNLVRVCFVFLALAMLRTPAFALVDQPPDHTITSEEHGALHAEIATLQQAKQGDADKAALQAMLPALFGLLAVFVKRFRPPASWVHEMWFPTAAGAVAAALAAIGQAALAGHLTWVTGLSAAVGGLSAWAGASHTNPSNPDLPKPPDQKLADTVPDLVVGKEEKKS